MKSRDQIKNKFQPRFFLKISDVFNIFDLFNDTANFDKLRKKWLRVIKKTAWTFGPWISFVFTTTE